MAGIDPIPNVPEPGTVPRSRGLGALVENSLLRVFVQLFNRIKDALSGVLRHALESSMESLEAASLRLGGPVLDRVIGSADLPEEVRSMLSKARAGQEQIGIAVILGALIAIATSLFPAAVSGATSKLAQASANMFKSGLVDPVSLIRGYWWDPKWYSMYIDELHHHGYTDDQIALMEDVLHTKLSAGDHLALWRRGKIGDAELGNRLNKIGIEPSTINDLIELTDLIPGPGDLVRFALREAWRDDVAQAYGYDADYVSEFGEWMEKQGYSVDWAKRYWRSHWQVPSVGQAFEMLHRGVIGEKELDDLLKVQDIPAGWRANLNKIAYTPLGRIDTRWAYEEGIIGEEKVFESYKAQGYTDKDADIMTRITVSKTVSETKGLTRSAVESAYKKRRLSRSEALSMLGDLGIQTGVAEFYLDQADQDAQEELLDTRVAAVKALYTNGQIDQNGVFEQLGSLGLATGEIEADLELWDVSRSAKVKRPTRANLDRFFLEGTIDLDEYRQRMRLLSYPDSDISLYVTSLANERAADVQDAARKAREEQDKVRASKQKTDYQVAKAQIDTDVAELQEAIAAAQVALVEAESERDLELSRVLSVEQIAGIEAEYKPALRDVDQAIAEARLSISALQTKVGALETDVSNLKRSLSIGRDVAKQEKLTTERLSLDTTRSSLDTRIAGRRTTIAELQESQLTMTEAADLEASALQIAALKTEIAGFQEEQAKIRERQEEIDQALQETYSLEERAAIEAEIATNQTLIAELNEQMDDLRQTIREAQAERTTVEGEMQAQVEQLPGKVEQIQIRTRYDAETDDLRSRIAVLRDNVAKLRMDKSRLAVEYRRAGG